MDTTTTTRAPDPSSGMKQIRNDKIPITLLESAFTVSELQDICKRHGLPVGGREIDLISTIVKAQDPFYLSVGTGTTPPPPTPPAPKPWPAMSFIAGSNYDDVLKSRSAALLDDGTVKCKGYYGGFDTWIRPGRTHFEDDLHAGYNGSARLSDGRTIHLPALAKSFAFTDHATGETSYHHGTPFTTQIRNGAELEPGSAVMSTFTPHGLIYHYDTYDHILTNVPFDNKETVGFTGWYGIVGDGRGNVVLPPWAGTRLTKIDGGFNVRQSGHFDGYNGTTEKYSGGCYHEPTGIAYFFPRWADGILISKMLRDDYDTEIHLPFELVDAFAGRQKAFDCFVGPDGLIYSVPWGAPIMFRINPETYEIDWREYPLKLPPNTNAGWGLYTRAERISPTEVVLVPGGMPLAAKLTF